VKPFLVPLVVLALVAGARPALAQQPGSIVGSLALEDGPAKKWASRYPGSGPPTSAMHSVSAVVYLEGDLPSSGGPGAPASIEQTGGRFVPGALAVRTGTTVRFPNADPHHHNVYSYSGPRFDLGRYAPGESREVVLDEPGIVRVFCEIHEFMRAVVLVTDHGFHAVVAEDGTFRIEGVPPGSYTLKAYHPDLGTSEVEVTVSSVAPTRVVLEWGG